MPGLWTRDLFVDDDESVGLQISHLAQALTTWAMMRGQAGPNPTVAEAMLTFNTTQDVIEEAVREGRWLYTIEKGGDPLKTEICVDGE